MSKNPNITEGIQYFHSDEMVDLSMEFENKYVVFVGMKINKNNQCNFTFVINLNYYSKFDLENIKIEIKKKYNLTTELVYCKWNKTHFKLKFNKVEDTEK